MFNVGFLSSGVTRACLNAVGKMPVQRDVLIMCVSAGKSVGEIAWIRWEGIGSRGHVVGWLERRSLDTSASVRGQKEKMGVWAVDVVGWRSCVCGGENWLLIVLVLSVKKVAKSSAVYRSGGRWWRGTEERIKCSEEITHVWSAVDLVVEMWGFSQIVNHLEEFLQFNIISVSLISYR